MEINYNKVNQTLNSLPVGYYLKRKIDVTLTYEDSSYYNLCEDYIHISYPTIENVITNISKTLDEETLEYVTRCLLYHEVSHAFLTPNMRVTDIINIFEDERIETICRNYYLGVNFKQFVKLVNNYQPGTIPQTALQLFYQIVRFNEGPQQFIDKKNTLIEKYLYINCSTKIYDTRYVDDVYEFWYEVEDYFNNQQNQQSQDNDSQESDSTSNEESQQNQQSQDNDSQESDSTSNEESQQNQQSQDNDSQESDSENLEEGQNDSNDIDNDTINNALQKSLEDFKNYSTSLLDKNLQEMFTQLLLRKKSNSKNNGSAINSYSGRFDVRSVTREDYKWFVQSNRLGNVKRFSKIKLNLFIDSSGSFSYSQGIVNKLLYNLNKLEKQNPDFSYDVISMEIGEKILPKNKRYISCDGCNKLDADIYKIYKQVQDNQSENYNIVLFDGDAFSALARSQYKDYSENFKAFNHENCIIISDTENKNYINKYCKNAKTKIIWKDYATELINTIIKTLQTTIR